MTRLRLAIAIATSLITQAPLVARAEAARLMRWALATTAALLSIATHSPAYASDPDVTVLCSKEKAHTAVAGTGAGVVSFSPAGTLELPAGGWSESQFVYRFETPGDEKLVVRIDRIAARGVKTLRCGAVNGNKKAETYRIEAGRTSDLRPGDIVSVTVFAKKGNGEWESLKARRKALDEQLAKEGASFIIHRFDPELTTLLEKALKSDTAKAELAKQQVRLLGAVEAQRQVWGCPNTQKEEVAKAVCDGLKAFKDALESGTPNPKGMLAAMGSKPGDKEFCTAAGRSRYLADEDSFLPLARYQVPFEDPDKIRSLAFDSGKASKQPLEEDEKPLVLLDNVPTGQEPLYFDMKFEDAKSKARGATLFNIVSAIAKVVIASTAGASSPALAAAATAAGNKAEEQKAKATALESGAPITSPFFEGLSASEVAVARAKSRALATSLAKASEELAAAKELLGEEHQWQKWLPAAKAAAVKTKVERLDLAATRLKDIVQGTDVDLGDLKAANKNVEASRKKLLTDVRGTQVFACKTESVVDPEVLPRAPVETRAFRVAEGLGDRKLTLRVCAGKACEEAKGDKQGNITNTVVFEQEEKWAPVLIAGFGVSALGAAPQFEEVGGVTGPDQVYKLTQDGVDLEPSIDLAIAIPFDTWPVGAFLATSLVSDDYSLAHLWKVGLSFRLGRLSKYVYLLPHFALGFRDSLNNKRVGELWAVPRDSGPPSELEKTRAFWGFGVSIGFDVDLAGAGVDEFLKTVSGGGDK